jgi:intein/homing endonuclease
VRAISREVALRQFSVGGLTPQRLHAELLEADARETRAYLSGAQRDGTYSRIHRTLRISQSDIRWLHVLQDLFLKLGSRSWVYREGKRNVWVVETTCRLAEARFSNPREKSAFVRGYFDAEGGIPRNRDARFYVQFVQKNRGDLERVQSFSERSRHSMRSDP